MRYTILDPNAVWEEAAAVSDYLRRRLFSILLLFYTVHRSFFGGTVSRNYLNDGTGLQMMIFWQQITSRYFVAIVDEDWVSGPSSGTRNSHPSTVPSFAVFFQDPPKQRKKRMSFVNFCWNSLPVPFLGALWKDPISVIFRRTNRRCRL